MDYNLFVAQTLETPEIFSEPLRLEDTVVEAYMNYFKKNYFGNRAPLHIGHHFTDYAGKSYERSLMRFIENVAGRPDVKFCTYMQLVDVLRPSHAAEVADG